jgi:DNA-binding transcriptional regulator YdaS (Cro superfamily)
MELTGYTVKQLQHELAVEGVHVSQQAISQWITGATAPRPENQVAIARIIAADPTALFPLDAA